MLPLPTACACAGLSGLVAALRHAAAPARQRRRWRRCRRGPDGARWRYYQQGVERGGGGADATAEWVSRRVRVCEAQLA